MNDILRAEANIGIARESFENRKAKSRTVGSAFLSNRSVISTDHDCVPADSDRLPESVIRHSIRGREFGCFRHIDPAAAGFYEYVRRALSRTAPSRHEDKGSEVL